MPVKEATYSAPSIAPYRDKERPALASYGAPFSAYYSAPYIARYFLYFIGRVRSDAPGNFSDMPLNFCKLRGVSEKLGFGRAP